MRDLENCRQEIDEIDAELVRLFERRMGVCRDVALYKQAHYMDILNAAREEAVLKSRAQQAGDPALAQSVMALFTEIMRLSRSSGAIWKNRRKPSGLRTAACRARTASARWSVSLATTASA